MLKNDVIRALAIFASKYIICQSVSIMLAAIYSFVYY